MISNCCYINTGEDNNIEDRGPWRCKIPCQAPRASPFQYFNFRCLVTLRSWRTWDAPASLPSMAKLLKIIFSTFAQPFLTNNTITFYPLIRWRRAIRIWKAQSTPNNSELSTV